MKNSLPWRFAIIIGIILLAGVVVLHYPLKLGIDLAGGTSLLYELDLSKIQTNSQESESELAGRVIAVLKNRVDPYGQKNLIWRVVGNKRIQIQMPRADKATIAARAQLQDAQKNLEDTALHDSEIQRAITLSEPARSAAIDKVSPPNTERNNLLHKLAAAKDEQKAADALIASRPPDDETALKAKTKADDDYQAAKEALDATNVDMGKLLSLIDSADNPANADAQKELAALPSQYLTQKPQIEAVIAAHKKLMSLSGGGVDDPNDLQRLITTTGVLDFRITVNLNELKKDPESYNAAIQSLKQYGPTHPVVWAGTRVRWMQIDPQGANNFKARVPDPRDPTGKAWMLDWSDKTGEFVTSEWAGQHYVLCYDDQVHTLTHEAPRQPWTVTAGAPYGTDKGLLLPFSLDAGIGAKYMGDLTTDNLYKPMAILLDDKAMSAPTINNRIDDQGTISFGQDRPAPEVKKEADDLKQIIDAGSLPASLQREPISKVEITPDLGADNIEAGEYSGIYALIAVVAFMLIYYTITGFFADLALAVNLLLVLAAMAALGGTFTLPGIAGLVLTLGMAVDANVLINERIREEIHKGASLWMAVKQGYDKVFWTIFDANTTCSLTSIVLIYVGSEEVKGFGVTLLIGLCIHMFTALFVTRTLMMGAIKVGIIRAIDDHSVAEYLREIFTFTWLRNGHWPFMRVITVTNIDWIGKRHIFWVISAITIIAGLVTFVARGEDKYDIEFRGGTQVTFRLKPGANLTQDQVRKRIESLADYEDPTTRQHYLKDLKDARVYGIGKPEEHDFEMQTTIANPKDQPDFVKKELLDPLAAKFQDVLNSKPTISVKLDGDDKPYDTEQAQINDLMDVKGVVRPITANTLDQVFANTNVQGIPNRDVTNQVGGVAILLDNINPPQTAKQLADRITQTRQSQAPDLRNIPNRNSKIIPIAAAGNAVAPESGEDDTVPLTRAVVVSKDDHFEHPTNASDAEWRTAVAAQEWHVVQTALTTESQFEGVTSFDAVVASQAKLAALTAIILSLILIVAYVWIRFGGIRYGLGAIFSLVHDAIVAVAATVLSGEIYNHVFHTHNNFLLISDFKINLTMIAAYLTVIGYSVNDTIVIFDRVRELRGKSQAPLSPKLVNDAINQCFGRTIWTTFTVFIVVLIMYIFGGEGIRGFSFAMLIGVITGAYSTLAIASPMLLATASAKEKAAGPKPPTANPFLKAAPQNP